MEPLTPGRVTSRAGSPSLSHRAFPPFCPQPPHGAPSSLLCSPQLCQRDGLPVPFQIPAFLMPLGVRQVWASHTPSRLAAPCSRNGFVILRTGGSPSVALHPALRQRSYFRFRVGGAYPEGTCTPLTLRLGGAPGAGHARDGRRETVVAATGYAGRQSARGYVPTLKHGNDQMLLPQDFPSRGGRPAPPGGRFGAGRVSGEANSPLALSRSAGCGTGKKGQAV